MTVEEILKIVELHDFNNFDKEVFKIMQKFDISRKKAYLKVEAKYKTVFKVTRYLNYESYKRVSNRKLKNRKNAKSKQA